MQWADVSIDSIDRVWTIPGEAREKGSAGELVLPALAIVEAQPRLGNNAHVFAGRGDGPINAKAKGAFDAKLPRLAPWVLHDLRRTARSLMSRAGGPISQSAYWAISSKASRASMTGTAIATKRPTPWRSSRR
jgi:hypothetical protein